MADDRGTSAMVFLAFLSGVTMGAVAALLLAPQSGDESRDQIRKYARRAENDLRDLAVPVRHLKKLSVRVRSLSKRSDRSCEMHSMPGVRR